MLLTIYRDGGYTKCVKRMEMIVRQSPGRLRLRDELIELS